MDGFSVTNANRFLQTGSLPRADISADSRSTSISDSATGANGVSFADTLKQAVNSVNQLSIDANRKAQELSTGKTDDIAAVMIASEKADIALRAMVQVRNKIIDAYQEIMRMQV